MDTRRMTRVLVDSNVLIDFFNADSPWHMWARTQIESVSSSASLAINPIIYAEVSLRFTDEEELDSALPSALMHREPLPWRAAFLAGRAFLQYRRSGGEKTSVMPDFFIGAHAVVQEMPLLTRDVRRYKTYFPALRLICP